MKLQIPPCLAIGAAISALTLGGCTSTAPVSTNDPTSGLRAEYENRIKVKDSEISSLKSSLNDVESSLAASKTMSSGTPSDMNSALLPPNAKAGECYARVFVPPRYESVTEQVLKTAASQRIETIPAQFATEQERVLLKEASERLEVVPATYEWVTEQLMVKPAATKLVAVPAQYREETERVLIKPEQTVWKKGSGPISKIDESTGEIMCLVTVPAEYSTISRKVLVSEATTREIEIPAEYKTVKRKVMKTPPTTRKIEIPAEYSTVKVTKLASAATTRSTEIPAQYQTLTRRNQVSDGYLQWTSILCETNLTPTIITNLQRALTREGVYGGPIDGIVGSQTVSGLRAYQKKKGMPTGGITIDTLKSLGVSI